MSQGNALNVVTDVLGLSQNLQNSILAFTDTSDREAFVKNLMEQAYYASGQKYNVMVFNLGQSYTDSLNGVQFYGSAVYMGTITYGIWVFESGSFTNNGDGGWINWAANGNITRNNMTMTFAPIGSEQTSL